jgi:hypothetical protein
MKAQLILIAILAPSLLVSSTIQIQIESPFILVDPLEYKQPALRLYLIKDDPESKASISLHKEIITGDLPTYLAKTKNYMESIFPLTFALLGERKRSDGKALFIALIEFKKEAHPLKLLQAFYLENQELYVISYSCIPSHFGKYLDPFYKVLSTFTIHSDWKELYPEPIRDSIEKKLVDLKMRDIPLEKFTKTKEVLAALKETVLSQDAPLEYLLTFRDVYYEK